VTTLDASGTPLPGDVVAGQAQPPRGWQSRHYGAKHPVPSLAVERGEALPATRVSILSAGVARVQMQGQRWTVTGPSALHFSLRRGLVDDVEVGENPGPP
jgi:hypothetical protein